MQRRFIECRRVLKISFEDDFSIFDRGKESGRGEICQTGAEIKSSYRLTPFSAKYCSTQRLFPPKKPVYKSALIQNAFWIHSEEVLTFPTSPLFCATPKLAELNAAAFKKAPFSVATLCIWGTESCGVIGIFKKWNRPTPFPPKCRSRRGKKKFQISRIIPLPRPFHSSGTWAFREFEGERRCFFLSLRLDSKYL